MNISVKKFDTNKLKDLLNLISDDIDEDDMKSLKGFIQDFKQNIKKLKKEKSDINSKYKKINIRYNKALNCVKLYADEKSYCMLDSTEKEFDGLLDEGNLARETLKELEI